MNATLIPVNGERKETEVETLGDVRELVGGYVTMVPVGPHTYWCDEDGLMKNRPVNTDASAETGQVLVGPVVKMVTKEARRLKA